MVLPAYDNHLHLSPSGRNIDALREFQAAGGTGLTLVTLPYPEVMISDGDDFIRSFGITLSLAEKAREMTDLKINVSVGPYPVLLISLAERFGLEKAEKMMIEGMEHAAALVADGKANSLGEIGRPHFPVDDVRIIEASNRILLRGMELAHEVDCPVIIHCESEDYTDRSLAELADEAGLDRGKVIKHSSPPWVTPEETHGVMPSIPASRSLIREALSKGDRFMIETDYIDDPEKPTAIMAVTTVPKRVLAWVANGQVPLESIYRICKDIPDSLYHR
ncbi:MAG: TatD family hydrolase [Candidatus Methanomethylophilaceae archaeon]|nr:TatD family hydrolase [Candidatus Methanomethylophilaceae archaeon]